MDDKNILNNVKEIAETTKKVLPMTTNKIDGTLSTLIEWVDNVLFFPLKKASITYRYKLEDFEKDLSEKIKAVPMENLKEPQLSIIGPTLEALKYTIDERDLREMYINLLVSSMDNRKDNAVHPSFIEIIKQMDPFDAKLFKYIFDYKENLPVIKPTLHVKYIKKYIPEALPEWFLKCNLSDNIFQISNSILHLAKFGIINLLENKLVQGIDYNYLFHSVELSQVLNTYKKMYNGQDFEIQSRKCAIMVNDYGRQFAKTCL